VGRDDRDDGQEGAEHEMCRIVGFLARLIRETSNCSFGGPVSSAGGFVDRAPGSS
jgi:hypothetical protein